MDPVQHNGSKLQSPLTINLCVFLTAASLSLSLSLSLSIILNIDINKNMLMSLAYDIFWLASGLSAAADTDRIV